MNYVIEYLKDPQSMVIRSPYFGVIDIQLVQTSGSSNSSSEIPELKENDKESDEGDIMDLAPSVSI